MKQGFIMNTKQLSYWIYIKAFFNTSYGKVIAMYCIGYLFLMVQFAIFDLNFTLTITVFKFKPVLNLTHPSFSNSGAISLILYRILIGAVLLFIYELVKILVGITYREYMKELKLLKH